jgi:hypothetical protein
MVEKGTRLYSTSEGEVVPNPPKGYFFLCVLCVLLLQSIPSKINTASSQWPGTENHWLVDCGKVIPAALLVG